MIWDPRSIPLLFKKNANCTSSIFRIFTQNLPKSYI
jgi:hypothetical protein